MLQMTKLLASKSHLPIVHLDSSIMQILHFAKISVEMGLSLILHVMMAILQVWMDAVLYVKRKIISVVFMVIPLLRASAVMMELFYL